MKTVKKRKVLLLLTGILLGVFIILTSHSFQAVTTDFLRENSVDIFQEIKILKDKNRDLSKEVASLETTLGQLSDQNSALAAIDDEILKYKKLSGGYPVFGPGIYISINGDLTIPWIIDLTNEIFNAGAEAVSINGIRLTKETSGFDAIPNGKILINGAQLSSPYIFTAIGEPSTILQVLDLPGGIFSRIKASGQGIVVSYESREVVQMN